MAIEKDSKITEFEENLRHPEEDGGLELIYATSHSLIYRKTKDGKYFLIKRGSNRGEYYSRLLRREYELSIGCDHPNIVHVYEYRKDDESDGEIVMEYIDGRSLNDFLAENPPLSLKKKVFEELLDAVEYLHLRGVTHNDLKPENILISRSGDRLKLIDLGLSDNDTHFAIKTPGYSGGYAAPELKEERKSDTRSDIYSLGVLNRQIFGNRYKAIVRKCLRKSPEKRFLSVVELRKRWEHSNRNGIYLAAAFFILVIGVGIAWLFSDSSRQSLQLTSFEKTISDQAQTLSGQDQKLKTQNELLENQSREIESQKEAYSSLQDKYVVMETRYNLLKDSIHRAETEKEKIAAKKKAALEKYEKKLNELAAVSVDSINRIPGLAPVIFLNLSRRVMDLYNAENKIIEGEDLGPKFYSITNEFMESVMQKMQKK